MLLWERLSHPTGLTRDPALQASVDTQCHALALYQFKTCPFCIKVRQECRRLSLKIDFLDAQHNVPNREALVRGGGLAKVPCLKIGDEAGSSEWLYESDKIIDYLRGRFASA